MRIQKAPRNGTARVRNPTALSTHERVLWRDIGDIVSSPNKEIAAQLYVQRVMSPLLGPKHVDAGVGLFSLSLGFTEIHVKFLGSL